MEVVVVVGTLAALDLKALRQADRVSFHYWREDQSVVVPGSHIRATKQIEGNPFEKEREYIISVDSHFSCYADLKPKDIRHAFAYLSHAGYADEWRSVIHFLKVGDVLSFQWNVDNNSNLITEAGLHIDEFRLIVRRGNNKFAFILQVQVSKDNTARMCRRS